MNIDFLKFETLKFLNQIFQNFLTNLHWVRLAYSCRDDTDNAFSLVTFLRQPLLVHGFHCIIYGFPDFRWNAVKIDIWHLYFSLHKFDFSRWNMNDSTVINKLNLLGSAYSFPFLFLPV